MFDDVTASPRKEVSRARRDPTWSTRGAVVTMTLVVALMLAGCANVTSSGSLARSSSSLTNRPVTLCRDVSRVNELIVQRHALDNQLRFTFRPVVVVHHVESARAVLRGACALPVANHGAHCPIGLAVHYDLAVTVQRAKGTRVATIVLYPTGCQTLSGLGAVRTAALHQSFFRILGDAMGLHLAEQPTFEGRPTT